jgi:serine/threonine protein kinase
VTDGSFAQGLVGVTLDGRYRLDAVLGEGGMGSVFRATQLAMDRKVAVKLLKPHLTGDQAALKRFAREARATFKVDSPHAVKILDFGITPVGDYYMVLEYLDGRTVHRELEIDGPFAPQRVAHIARQALHALGVAHAQGLIHRDVKPDNLLLMRVGSDPDYTKILDFGVAKLMQGAAPDRSQLALTAAGMVFGTPEFMSPEQACGQEVDSRSDLYSLAATMFVMLTGAPLFEGKNAIELLTHQARTPPPRLAMARPELAAYPALDDLLQRCLAKHRRQRPASAAEMAALLEQLGPTLTRSAGALRSTAVPDVGAAAVGQAPTPPTAFHGSSYFAPLPQTVGDAAAPPWSGHTTASQVADLPRAIRRSRPRRRRWLVGAVVAALLGVALGLAIRTSTSGSASIFTDAAPAAGQAAAAPVRPAAAVPAGVSMAPAASVAAGGSTADPSPAAASSAPGEQAAAASRPPAGPGAAAGNGLRAPPAGPPAGSPRAQRAAQRAAAEEHLRNAESALRENNLLKQLVEADLALRADRRNVRARYLLGDALIKNGDLDRGCAYLRVLGGNRLAQQRAQAAGCPSD